MSFAHPWILLFLVLPLLQLGWEWRRRGLPLVMPFDHVRLRRGRAWRRLITSAECLPALLLAVVICLLAGPQRFAAPDNERVLTNILFCLDVSGSMMSPFGEGRRADKAIEAIQEFTSYRKGDAFGLSVFGTEVIHWVPVTKDLSAIRLSAPFIRPEKMPPYMGGTRIGFALRAVQKSLLALPEGDRMVILVSDGESADLYGGQAEELGSSLSRDGIVVYYIHVAQGQPQNETLTLAGLTGGQAFSAGDPAALHEVFQRIDGMHKARTRPGVPEAAEFFTPFTLAGLGLGLLQLLAQFGLRYTPW